MSRRVTGWLLLALAVIAAVVVGLLARRDGALDGWLGATVALALVVGVGVVVLDARHERRRRSDQRDEAVVGR